MDKRLTVKYMLRLYAITDRSWLKGRDLVDMVAEALDAGITCLQLREKDATPGEEEKLAREIQALCKYAKVPFIINDNVELAARIGADGVHVGQDDMACSDARRRLGRNAIIGVSASTVEQARAAQAAGADYLGVGALFHTDTKPEAGDLTPAQLREICDAVDIPVVAIGGLNAQTIPVLANTGVAGAAVVSGIFAADDVEAAVEELLDAVGEIL